MGEESKLKAAKLYVMHDGLYEKINAEIRDIQVEDELSHRPDLVEYPKTFSFNCEVEFHVSLMTWIRLLGFSEGIKVWFWTKFRRK